MTPKEYEQRLRELTGKDVSFVCMEGDLYVFSLKRYRSYKEVDRSGNTIREAEIHDEPFRPRSLPIWYELKLADVDLDDDQAARYMIDNHMSRTPLFEEVA